MQSYGCSKVNSIQVANLRLAKSPVFVNFVVLFCFLVYSSVKQLKMLPRIEKIKYKEKIPKNMLRIVPDTFQALNKLYCTMFPFQV